MSYYLKNLFDEKIAEHLSIDKSLARRIYSFQINFINKNSEHIEFFGGNLTGVNTVRFTDRDLTEFFEDILYVDLDDLKHALKNVLFENSITKESWKISNDVFNLTCFYLIHMFLTNNKMPEKDRQRAALDVSLLFNYRCIAALTSHYFQYTIDRKTAESTYANLSQRFLIKRLGSWNEVMLYRAQSILSKENAHLQNIIEFKDDYSIIVALNDAQSRVKDILKNIYAEFIKVHTSGDKINTSSSLIIDSDGAEVIKDKIHGLESYISYLMSVLYDKDSFIKYDLVEIVSRLVFTVNKKNLITVLTWMSDNSMSNEKDNVEGFIKEVMIYNYKYLTENKYVLKNKNDIPGLLAKLKNVYMSSRSNEKELLDIRDNGEKLILKALQKVNIQQLASVRTA